MRTVLFGLFLLILAAAGWSALWFYAAHEAGAQFDTWLKTEDSQGRDWTCPDRAIGGFPFAVTVTCTKPTFTGRALDQTVEGQVAGLTAEAAITHPKRIVVALQSPLAYKTSDHQAEVQATFSSLSVDLDGLPNIQSIVLHCTDLAVDGAFAGTGREGGKAALLDATFALAPQDQTVNFNIAVGGSVMPSVDELLGGHVPVDITLVGRLDHAVASNARTPAEAIEMWRQAAGRIELASSRLARAESSVTGSGTLQLDEAHRPQGRLDASFVGLEPILQRYGISGDLAAAGSLLSTLFGGGRPAAAPATPGALNLPISFQDGRLGIGPIRTQIALPPLY